MGPNAPEGKGSYEMAELGLPVEPSSPMFCGVQLKYIS
jgi:hypothetical protein